MNKNLKKLLIILIIVNITTLFFARMPVIYNIVVDSSSSVSESDFKKANAAVAIFLELLYQKSQALPGETADWIAVSWFGSSDDYVQTPYYNCSDIDYIRTLQYIALKVAHPKFGSTAIYTSILKSLYFMVQHDEKLPSEYLKITIVITDGEDNDSLTEHKNYVKQLYPNEYNFVFIVGVGSGAKINEFAKLTLNNDIYSINNFGELGTILAVIGEAIEDNILLNH